MFPSNMYFSINSHPACWIELSCCLCQASAKKAKAPYDWKHADLDRVVLFLEDEIAYGRFPFKGINYEEGYVFEDEDP